MIALSSIGKYSSQISDYQQRMSSRSLRWAILIPPALPVVADFMGIRFTLLSTIHEFDMKSARGFDEMVEAAIRKRKICQLAYPIHM
jgi:hypothetical protein